MPPTDVKIIAVACATKRQGLSVVRAIVNDKVVSFFNVRAFVQEKPSTTDMDWMKKNGVEVREVSLEDEAALTKALDGVYGFFASTPFWQNPEVGIRQAKAMADAAKKAGVKHVIWSTLEDTRRCLEEKSCPTLNDRFKVPHFDSKGEADEYFDEKTTTYLLTSCFWDNFIDCGMVPKKTPDGKLALSLPMGDKRLAGMASEDVGKCVVAIFKQPDRYMGMRLGVVGEILTIDEIAKKMSKALNKEVVYKKISFDEYRSSNDPSCKEIGNIFQFYHDHEEFVLSIRHLDESKRMNPEMMTFDDWLAKYKDQIPVSSA